MCGDLSLQKQKFLGYVQNDTSNLNCRETTHFRGEKDLKSVHDIIRPCYTAILVWNGIIPLNSQQLTNKDTICWIKESVDYLKISQDELKEESIKFLGDECACLFKQENNFQQTKQFC